MTVQDFKFDIPDYAEYSILTGFHPDGIPDVIDPLVFREAIRGELTFFMKRGFRQYRSPIFPAWEFVVLNDDFVNIGLN